jgi:hypothetical protein
LAGLTKAEWITVESSHKSQTRNKSAQNGPSSSVLLALPSINGTIFHQSLSAKLEQNP